MKETTKILHSIPVDELTGAISTPIYQTSTYVQEAPGVNKGYDYARSNNPTRKVLEDLISKLENGENGYAFASGLAAIDAVVKLLQSGDEIVAVDDIYGGAFIFFVFGTVYQQQRVVAEHKKYDQIVSNGLTTSYLYNPTFLESRSIIGYVYSYQIDKRAYENYLNTQEIRNGLALGAVAVYLAQLIHCYLIGKSAESELEGKKASMDFNYRKESFAKKQGIATEIKLNIYY